MGKNRVRVFGFVISLFFSGGLAFGQPAFIDAFSGAVQVLPAPGRDWQRVQETPFQLDPGSRVKTGAGEYARIMFDDGSRVLLNSDSDLSVKAAEPANIEVELKVGTLMANVKKILARRFAVRTPPAVCAVRGTYFHVSVAGDGRTEVRLYDGLLHITDLKGGETLLRPNEMIEIDKALGSPKPIPAELSKPAQEEKDSAKTAKQAPGKDKDKEAAPADFRDAVGEKPKGREKQARTSDWEDFRGKGVLSDRDALIREVHSDIRKDTRQRMEILETRIEQNQGGKVSIDENGNRVRREDIKLSDGRTVVIERGGNGNSNKTYDPLPSGGSGGGNTKPARPDNGKGKVR